MDAIFGSLFVALCLLNAIANQPGIKICFFLNMVSFFLNPVTKLFTFLCAPFSGQYFLFVYLSNQGIELIQRGVHLYHFSTFNKTWNDAEDFCQQHGGHLASIHSNDEEQFIIHEAYKKR